MRQRSITNRNKIVEECSRFLVTDAARHKGMWRSLFEKDAPIKLELGSGKGRFITELAKQHPEFNYIACEGAYNVFPRILQKAAALELPNLLVLGEYIIEPCEVFEDGELDGIYLNFSDPWKPKYSNRRLTYRKKLESYSKVCRKGASLEFKTDNDELFEYSLEELDAVGLKPSRLIYDLHSSELAQSNIMTEYEEKFSSEGIKIKYFCITFAENL